VGHHSRRQEKFREAVTQAINSGQKVLGTIMLNPHPFADEIKRRPEVEVLLVTRDNRAEVMKKVLNWLTEGVN
jgi:nucleoside-triphosphatase